jgi:BirA family biotin operon repressor/biotin-[acetyl-CoA-carboxylase] ligase
MSLDAEILSALRASGEAVSGADLAGRLGVSRTAVWARIEELRRLGYEIQASPHQGYHLVSAPDRLHGDDLQVRLGAVRVIGRDIRVFEETTSTNDVIDRLARDGTREGVVVLAEAQTRGRGRLGRRWFSVLLRPRLPPGAITQLTIAAATAVARGIATAGVVPEIKWPNDLLVRGRKVAGLLTEMHAELDSVRHVTLGIGLNVNHAAADFPPELRPTATSLRQETGRWHSRPDLAVACLRELDHDYQRMLKGEFEALADEWAARCTTLGRLVRIQTGSRRVEGRAESLDAEGALLVRTQYGHLERVIGGDVTVEK